MVYLFFMVLAATILDFLFALFVIMKILLNEAIVTVKIEYLTQYIFIVYFIEKRSSYNQSNK